MTRANLCEYAAVQRERYGRARSPPEAHARVLCVSPAAVAGIAHALILVGLGWMAAGRLTTSTPHRFAAVYLLTWCNPIVTALALSVVSKLNHLGLYLSVSVLLGVTTNALLRHQHIAPVALASPRTNAPEHRVDRLVRRAALVILLLAALASALICIAYVPNNWDSATYRFSRAFFYLARGDLLHTGNLGDPRLTFYPLNGALLYVFFAIHQFPPQALSFVTYAAWVFAVGGVYLAARALGASRTGSSVAAWLCGLAPNILSQATATTDEVLAAVPILLGFVFLREFWLAELRRFAILAGIGFGLGLGTKLHWVFYSVFTFAAALLLTVRALREPQFRAGVVRRLPALVMAGLVALSLSVSFIVCNYISAGRITDPEFNNTILNQPFRLSLALEKMRVNTAELFISPLPDLIPPLNREQRRAAYVAFNKFFMQCCFSDLKETTVTPYPGGYSFQGPANPDGYLFYEYTWLGFLPHLLLLVCILGIASNKIAPACVVLAASFFIWHATMAAQTRYQAGYIYYSYPAILATAALGPAWDIARNSRSLLGRVLLLGFSVVFATHMVLASNLLAFGGLRNLQFLARRQPPPEAHPVGSRVVQAVQAARNIYLPFTHWEILYWNIMRHNPAAWYTTGLELRTPSHSTLMLLHVLTPTREGWLAARLPHTIGPGLTYLGIASSDHIFAQGDLVHARFPEESGYAIARIAWDRNPVSGALSGVRSVRCCVGLNGADRVQFRYELMSQTTARRIRTNWSLPEHSVVLPTEATVNYDALAIEARDGEKPDVVVRTVHSLTEDYSRIGTNEVGYSLRMNVP